MFCTQCGAKLADNAAFCSSCGAAVPGAKASANVNASANTSANEKVYANANGAYRADAFVQSTQAFPAAQSVQNPEGKSTSLPTITLSAPVIAAIVAGVIALIAIVCAVVFFVGGHTASDSSATSSQSGQSTAGTQGTTEQKSQATMQVSQVDNSAFPQVTLYARLVDSAGAALTNVAVDQFQVIEYDSAGTEYAATIAEIAQLAEGDAMSINLVLDQSGSMSSSSKMANAKTAALQFVNEIASTSGAQAEVTSFADYVYNRQPFTSDSALLQSAVNSLSPTGDTALNDALYWALQRTNQKSGSRVVIAFTDGVENASQRSVSDVVELSRATGIPVYIIGVGSDVEASSLQSLATSCNGAYFDAATSNLAATLASIYDEIYVDQRSLFRIVFTSSYTGDESSYRTVRLSCSDASVWTGSCETSYVPQDNVSLVAGITNSADYVLPDSSTRLYSRSELEQLSLWELYLARNEIFARYGRGFKNQDLVEYFATRTWYTQRYTPEEFDAMPTPLNDYEQDNTQLMLEIERERNSPYLVTAK